ncbi:hypothetical protein [uncultured Pseudokineococcus sp.]|uniref:hypothetical protein n=1 Tax=uncultured Pseudokineococcus sp. TaxID=1642928 RepID=UPI00260A0BC2|nr:hypothetical protein [uncultured Pseudokineococcus sp.]
MAQTSTRRSAAAAARELMSAKIKTIEDLAQSLDDWRASRAAIDEAVAAADAKAADVRTAHETARASGWSVAELRDLGLEPPAQPRRRRTGTDATDGASNGAARTVDAHAPTAPENGA